MGNGGQETNLKDNRSYALVKNQSRLWNIKKDNSMLGPLGYGGEEILRNIKFDAIAAWRPLFDDGPRLDC